ncbi:MAG TPA: HupE/UreJ family protein [Xanthobacteraceae bacterium]|nr:HupE/UreJ family protein [Xanthobacteraceae bacterium]
MRASVMQFSLAAALAGGALSASSATALAHVGPYAADFTGGLAHPLTGLDHLLAALAVGLLASQLERPARWLLPIVFAVAMIVGALLAIGGPALSMIESAIAASVLVLGALIAGARRLAMIVAGPLVALFAALHGYSHALAAPAQGALFAYYTGFTMAALALVGIGLAVGRFAARTRLRPAARAAGAVIAAVGAVLLLVA